MTAPIQSSNTARLIGAGAGVLTVLIGVFAFIYNDKVAAAGIVTSGLGITVHSLA